jgi:hypothetical protein
MMNSAARGYPRDELPDAETSVGAAELPGGCMYIFELRHGLFTRDLTQFIFFGAAPAIVVQMHLSSSIIFWTDTTTVDMGILLSIEVRMIKHAFTLSPQKIIRR